MITPAGKRRGEPDSAMTFCISIPVGEWSPSLPACFRSLALQAVPVRIALCDASGDPRIAAAADASGLDFAHRRHGPDAGQSDAIIEGWRETDGEILGWLNADDALFPGAMERAAAAFAADPDLDVWFGHSTIVDTEGATIGTHPAVAPVSDLLLRSCTISQPSCFFRRRAVDAIGGLDVSLHYTMDWDLWCRLYRNGAKFEFSDTFASAVLFELGTKTSTMPMMRIVELFRLVSLNAGRFAAAKSVLGFTLHHISAYTPLRPLLRRLRHQGVLPERAAGPTGLRASGSIETASTLPVLNLSDRPQTGLIVELTGPDATRAEIEIDGQVALGAKASFTLSTPVPAGDVVWLTVRRPSGAGPASLKSARWADA
tara:strand:+ start:3360 stop:4475 length:1116 start_codon:yes stop_codon:yes gene_type:complete